MLAPINDKDKVLCEVNSLEYVGHTFLNSMQVKLQIQIKLDENLLFLTLM